MKILYFMALLFLAKAAADSIDPIPVTPQPTLIQEQNIQQGHKGQSSEQQIDQDQLQRRQAEDLKQQTQGKLNEWVIQELKDAEKVRDIHFGDNFVTRLISQQSFEYKWTLEKAYNKKTSYTLNIIVYTYEVGDDATLNKNPDEDSFVQVQTKQNFPDSYTQLGKVYVSRAFTVNFASLHRFIRVTNFNPGTVLVEFNIQTEKQKQIENMIHGIAGNQHFAVPAEKLSTIFEELKDTQKSRERSFKWEWGFLQRQQRYDQQMLKLTGVELIAILATAIVQMYCIKNLLENQQII